MKLNKIVKIAFDSIELNDPVAAGYAIAQVIRFLIRRIPFHKRPFITQKIKQKIINLNEIQISQKEIPTTAILGQTIALTKNLLNGNEPRLIKNILINISKNL